MLERIAELVENGGYPGIVALMFAENLFPPIPSELIMPLAGFAAARGELNVFLAVAAGAAGSLAGAFFWYGVGRWLGSARLKRWADRHGRWLTLTPGDVDKSCAWFNRHSGKAVFIGRLVPAVRTLISVPAGIAGMGLARFLFYSALGTVLWTSFLAGLGYLLGDQYRQVSHWMNPVSNVIVGVLLLWYLYRVVTFRRRIARGRAG
jgi:membrane protein DedA with SNARE-associated domain